jgi:hypothetical protein
VVESHLASGDGLGVTWYAKYALSLCTAKREDPSARNGSKIGILIGLPRDSDIDCERRARRDGSKFFNGRKVTQMIATQTRVATLGTYSLQLR